MTTKNQTGSGGAFGNAIQSLDDRLRQLQSITPGAAGGGSVAAPFKIGDKTFGPGAQVDTNKLADIARPGTRWQAEGFLPTISQGVSTDISYTVRYSHLLVADEVVWNFFFIITSAGTAASPVVMTLPLQTFYPSAGAYVGTGQIFDGVGVDRYPVMIETLTSSTVAFGYSQTGGDGNAFWGAAPNRALAVTDEITGSISYRPLSEAG